MPLCIWYDISVISLICRLQCRKMQTNYNNLSSRKYIHRQSSFPVLDPFYVQSNLDTLINTIYNWKIICFRVVSMNGSKELPRISSNDPKIFSRIALRRHLIEFFRWMLYLSIDFTITNTMFFHNSNADSILIVLKRKKEPRIWFLKIFHSIVWRMLHTIFVRIKEWFCDLDYYFCTLLVYSTLPLLRLPWIN